MIPPERPAQTDLMTSAEVAAYFRRRSTETIRRWHRSGELPAAVVLGDGTLLWAREDVVSYRTRRAPSVRQRAEVVKDQMNAAYAAMLRKRTGA